MAALGRFLRRVASTDRQRIAYFCPACEGIHQIAIAPGDPAWTFDGNADAPTFSPSIRVTTSMPGGDEVCHHFVRAGRIEFCGDCTHEMRGQTVPLPEWPYAPGSYGGIEENV